MQNGRCKKASGFLLFWCLFIGIGAVAGATGMLSVPDGSALGMQEMLPMFRVLPFSEYLFADFVFPGIALLCVNGITNLIAAFLIIRKKPSGLVTGGVFGVTLMLWICIQFVIFPFNFMSTIYFVFGFAQAATGFAAYVFYKQECFVKPDVSDYPRIGSNKKLLVVYFSRMGYVKKLACEEADRTGAELLELHTSEPTAGTGGFWWCGRFALHRWDMPIDTSNIDLSKYDSVTICTPIWVFHICAPIRSFCRFAKGKISGFNLILVHFNKTSYEGAVREVEGLVGAECNHAVSVCMQKGKECARIVINGKKR